MIFDHSNILKVVLLLTIFCVFDNINIIKVDNVNMVTVKVILKHPAIKEKKSNFKDNNVITIYDESKVLGHTMTF